MYCLYQSNFEFKDIVQYNTFVKRILFIGEQYIKFLVSKNRIYLPVTIDYKDASVDLLAEIFKKENKVLVRFQNFFNNNFNDRVLHENEYDNYLQGFIAAIIQNNLIKFYKDNDPTTYNIYRNLREAAINLGFVITVHFSDKYVQLYEYMKSDKQIPEREELSLLVNSNGINGLVSNIPQFMEKLFEVLRNSNEFSPAARLSDLVNIVKAILANDFLINLGKNEFNTYIDEKININIILENIEHKYYQKLKKYITKNKLSQTFQESMYSLIDEVILDYKEGNSRRSVKELQKSHFGNDDKYLFYKVQYCMELFESEIINYYKEEQKLIG